jgi:hypothetical protein
MSLFLLITLLNVVGFNSDASSAASLQLPAAGVICPIDSEFRPATGIDTTTGTPVNLVCFPRRIHIAGSDVAQDSVTLMWSADRNNPPASDRKSYPLVDYGQWYGAQNVANPRTVAPTCPILKNIANQPFYEKYRDLYCNTSYPFVWRSNIYESGIDSQTIEVTPGASNVTQTDTSSVTTEPKQQIKPRGLIEDKNSAGSLVMAASALLTMMAPVSGIFSPVHPTNSPLPSDPNQNQSGVPPEFIEMKERRERQLKKQEGQRSLLAFLLSPKITLSASGFFTLKLKNFIERIATFTPVGATILGDGDYLRSVIGSLSFSLYPFAALLGVFEGFSSHLAPLNFGLPSLQGLTAIIFLGVFDALAGAIAGFLAVLTMFISRFSSHNFGHEARSFIAMLIATLLITTAPPLFSATLRRFDGIHLHSSRLTKRWDFLTDIALGPLVTAWIVWKVVRSLADIGGVALGSRQAFVDKWALWMGLTTWVALVLRYVIEHFVANNWADLLNSMVAGEVAQKDLYLALRVGLKGFWIWMLMATPLKGYPASLAIVIAIFVLPGALDLIWKNPPKILSRINFIGAPRIAFLFLLGFTVTKLWGHVHSSVGRSSLVDASLLILLLFSIIQALTDEHASTPKRYDAGGPHIVEYRILGALVFLVIAFAIFTSVLSSSLYKLW